MALIVTAAVAGCGSQGGAAGPSSGTPLTGTRWIPESITLDGREYPVPANRDAYVEFHPGGPDGAAARVGGSTGCNHFGAEVDIDGDTLDVSEVTQTLRGCSAEGTRFENRLLQILDGRLTAVLSDRPETLTLTGDDGDRITFTAESPRPLRGIRWTVTGLTVDGTSRSLPAGADGRAHFRLDRDGTVHGSLGCNTFTAKAAVHGSTIDFRGLTATEKACPEAVMTVEERIRTVLSGTVTYHRGHESLSLRRASGAGITATAG